MADRIAITDLINLHGHHVTNIVLTEVGPDEVTARSKAIGITAAGSCASLVYEDVVVRTPDGWLISRRKVVLRRRPLGR
ncbi:nuclear transport factor 2 family protein [Kribbella sp. NPDC058693]|uniref:nuclear transport factor 2 family protein n=1 Tax=Kribbella TaxID=182639 RepID=UPI00192D6475|nr:nuclear transport factor 2 family protein [Kribbella jiaozuonensis]